MKRIITIFAALLLTASVWAQSPEKMSYQAVVRDLSNNLVTNQPVGIRISILQDSINGTIVYAEIFNPNPSTNANGLVTVEIGGGVPLSGTFVSINWSNGPYFIKTEIDPTGGTNYTITGVNQLLSVPYALHAKTAETVTSEITEIDPIFSASPTYGITAGNITDWTSAYTHSTTTTGSVHGATTVGGNLLTLINPSAISFLRVNADNSVSALNATVFRTAIGAGTGTVTNISASNGISGGIITTTGTLGLTGQALALHNLGTNGIITRTGAGTVAARTITSGTGIIVTNGDGVSGNPTIAAKTYAIGNFAHGGIVFWVDATGQHGLVCAKTDQSTGVRWYAGTNGNTRAYGDGPLSGKANTNIIIAAHVAIGDDGSTYAARICNELMITEGGKTYGDWYLPSKEELNLMYINRTAINTTATANGGTSFASAFYWSSTENNNFLAWYQDFDYSNQLFGNKDYPNRVRAVRAF